MPGAIDLHTHIGGGKVNIARLMLEEFHTEQNPNFDSKLPGIPIAVKDLFERGIDYWENHQRNFTVNYPIINSRL